MGRPRATEATARKRFEAKIDKSSACWVWSGDRSKYGYGRFRPLGRFGPQALAHRFAYEEYVGPIPDGLQVCHKCDNPPCVRPDHLFIGTQADNMRDMCEKGRHAKVGQKGEANTKATLSDSDVENIRRLYLSGVRIAAIARSYGVNWTTAERAAKGITWRHVQVTA